MGLDNGIIIKTKEKLSFLNDFEDVTKYFLAEKEEKETEFVYEVCY